ncbi:amidase [Pseudomonas monteilii]|uniref:amidase n=1 Tax=Pseudomonas alabamensis TaxID=3064349 RepID=UPI00271445D4|nr:amidase [Pseudomonas sp. 22-AL-CL-001]MDO7910067.1 amidase [Pseudomonas sp. 22-AL-CL-001]
MIDRMSLARQAECVRTGVLSSVDLVNHYLTAIRQFNPAINAIIQMPDEAELLRQAAEADADVVRGKPLGPLHGVPITLKDVLHVRGFRLSRGVSQFLGGVSEQDATAVRRLREAGALFLGLTNVPELCMSFETDNLIYGRTNNPHDVQRTPGGSSGGEAAAIAAGLSPAGLASDAGGSVRLPAHFSGICGLKLTQGRVPLTGQFPRERAGLFHHTSSFGVMGRYVSDVETLGRLIAGPDGHDPDTVAAPWDDAGQPCDLQQLRVAFTYETARVAPSASVRRVLDQVREHATHLVGETLLATPPRLEDANELMWRLFITGNDGGAGWRQLLDGIGKRRSTPQLEGLVRMSEEVRPTVLEVKQDWTDMDQFRYQLAAFFRAHDLLITPVHPDVAFAHGQSLLDRQAYGYVFPFSLSGSPALVMNAGHDPVTGLPIGIQIVAPHWQEHRLLSFARALEARLPAWTPARPSTHTPVRTPCNGVAS